MTLRKLVWAYRERRRADGELAAWAVAMLVAYMPFVSARLDPRAINPYREAGTGSKAEEVRAFIAGMAWAALGKPGE